MNMKRFDLTYFYGPNGDLLTEEIFRDIADSGMTLCQLIGTTENNKKALAICERLGLRANCTDPRLYQAIGASPEEREELVRQVCADYTPFPAFDGFDIVDEPGASAFPALGEIVAAIRKYAPGYEAVINLFPNYASPEILGNPTYEAHLDDYCEKVKPDFISYDHYHFLGRNQPKPDMTPSGDRRSDLILENAYLVHDRPGFFENAQAVRDCARAHGIQAMAIVLLTEHGPYRNLTRSELAWEAGMCLAYGFKRVSYFTYIQPAQDDPNWTWDNAMVDVKGNRYPHWYDVQAISKWLLPLGRHLFELESEKVVHTLAFSQINCGRIRTIDGNAVCGCFSDGSVLIVNKNHALAGKFTVDADALERYLPEEDRFVPCEKEITLEAGECVLVR